MFYGYSLKVFVTPLISNDAHHVCAVLEAVKTVHSLADEDHSAFTMV